MQGRSPRGRQVISRLADCMQCDRGFTIIGTARKLRLSFRAIILAHGLHDFWEMLVDGSYNLHDVF